MPHVLKGIHGASKKRAKKFTGKLGLISLLIGAGYKAHFAGEMGRWKEEVCTCNLRHWSKTTPPYSKTKFHTSMFNEPSKIKRPKVSKRI